MGEKAMRVLIFGGTVEGRKKAEERSAAGDDVVVCVTSDYARRLLPPTLPVIVRTLPKEEMLNVMRKVAPQLIIDATHPFAVQATRNIAECAAQLSLPVLRILREKTAETDWHERVIWADDAAQAAQLLQGTEGRILLTTGSHTLGIYARHVPKERLFARLLPTLSSLEKAEQAGLHPHQVLAMQGPFTAAFNRALYMQWNIRVLVTKDSGEAGGLTDKIVPALKMGLKVIVIARPEEEA